MPKTKNTLTLLPLLVVLTLPLLTLGPPLLLLLVGGGVGAALLIGFVAYLVWRDRRRPRRGSPKPGGKNRLRIPRAGRAP